MALSSSVIDFGATPVYPLDMGRTILELEALYKDGKLTAHDLFVGLLDAPLYPTAESFRALFGGMVASMFLEWVRAARRETHFVMGEIGLVPVTTEQRDSLVMLSQKLGLEPPLYCKKCGGTMEASWNHMVEGAVRMSSCTVCENREATMDCLFARPKPPFSCFTWFDTGKGVDGPMESLLIDYPDEKRDALLQVLDYEHRRDQKKLGDPLVVTAELIPRNGQMRQGLYYWGTTGIRPSERNPRRP